MCLGLIQLVKDLKRTKKVDAPWIRENLNWDISFLLPDFKPSWLQSPEVLRVRKLWTQALLNNWVFGGVFLNHQSLLHSAISGLASICKAWSLLEIQKSGPCPRPCILNDSCIHYCLRSTALSHSPFIYKIEVRVIQSGGEDELTWCMLGM